MRFKFGKQDAEDWFEITYRVAFRSFNLTASRRRARLAPIPFQRSLDRKHPQTRMPRLAVKLNCHTHRTRVFGVTFFVRARWIHSPRCCKTFAWSTKRYSLPAFCW